MTYRVRLWKSEQGHCPCEENEIFMNYDPDYHEEKKDKLQNTLWRGLWMILLKSCG